MSASLHLLMLGGAAVLAGGSGSGLLILRGRERERAVQQRIEAVAAVHLKTRPLASAPITRRTAGAPQPGLRQVAKLFGYDPVGTDEGLRWYLVLPATLAVAFIASEMTAALLGEVRLLTVPVFWVMLSRTLWGWRREKRLTLLLMQFPDALAMITRSVRVGIPVTEAVRVVAHESPEPTRRSFAELASEIAIGVPLDSALPRMAERTGLAEYRFFATAIALQTQTGGTLSETLDNLAEVIRKRIALKARGKALSGEARASAGVLAVLPLLVGAALYAINPGYMSMLFVDPSGQKLFGVAVVSLAIGLLSMRMLIKKVLS